MDGLTQRSNDPDDRYLYSGKELDREHSLRWYYFGARYYHPALGRWLAVDPLWEKYPGWNPYNYVFNNPMMIIDPTGMDGEFLNKNINNEDKKLENTINSYKYDYLFDFDDLIDKSRNLQQIIKFITDKKSVDNPGPQKYSGNNDKKNSSNNNPENSEKSYWLISIGINVGANVFVPGISLSSSLGIAIDFSDLGNSRIILQNQENVMLGLGIALQGGLQAGISKISISNYKYNYWSNSSPYHIEGGIGWGPFFGAGIDFGSSPFFQKKQSNFGISFGLPVKVGGGAGIYLGGGIGFNQSFISLPIRDIPIYPINFP